MSQKTNATLSETEKSKNYSKLAQDSRASIVLPESLKHESVVHVPERKATSRYIPVTLGPDAFGKSPAQFAFPKQPVKIAVVVTMYNEELILFQRTITTLWRNIRYMQMKGVMQWQDIVVCVVSDGIKKINSETYGWMHQRGWVPAAKPTDLDTKAPDANGQGSSDIICHIFEVVDPGIGDFATKHPKQADVSMQILFCLKVPNMRKVNSHRWFFRGLCVKLQPTMCVLIDAGTCPDDHSLSALYKCFENDEHVAGACGEIYAFTRWYNWIFMDALIGSQYFEYKMSNILDKTFESAMGFITVLPGAFSAYRYTQLESAPLDVYFEGETDPGKAGVFKGNMNLAEDRILCLELVAKPGERNLLRYVSEAKAQTDVPGGTCGIFLIGLVEFVSQRRRWLNGSLFALLFTLKEMPKRLQLTDHTGPRKALLYTEWIYFCINVFFNWFALGNFFVAYFFLLQGFLLPGPSSDGNNLWFIQGQDGLNYLVYTYLGLVGLSLLISLINPNVNIIKQVVFTIIVAGFIVIGGLMLYITLNMFYHTLKFSNQTVGNEIRANSMGIVQIMLGFLSTYGLYWFASIIYWPPWHMIFTFVQYLVMQPVYINLLQIYAYSNIHDFSWGTKGASDSITGSFATWPNLVRILWVSSWLITNAGLAFLIIYFNLGSYYLVALVYILSFLAVCRVLGCIYYIATTGSEFFNISKVICLFFGLIGFGFMFFFGFRIFQNVVVGN